MFARSVLCKQWLVLLVKGSKVEFRYEPLKQHNRTVSEANWRGIPFKIDFMCEKKKYSLVTAPPANYDIDKDIDNRLPYDFNRPD